MVPLTALEYSNARWERIVKWLITALIICVIIIGGMGAYLLYDRSLYDYSAVTVDGRDDSMTTYIGADANGDISNGSDSSED